MAIACRRGVGSLESNPSRGDWGEQVERDVSLPHLDVLVLLLFLLYRLLENIFRQGLPAAFF